MAKDKKPTEVTYEEVTQDMKQSKSLVEHFNDNQKLVTYLIGGILLLVGGYFLYRQFIVAPKQKEVLEQMARAQFMFEQDSFQQAYTNPGQGFMGFADLVNQYGSTKGGNLCNYYAGACCLHLGQFDAAISYLEDFKPEGDITPSTRFGMIGDAYAEKNDMAQALSYYKKASTASDNRLVAAYYLKKFGMLNEYQGNKAEARQAYETIKNEYSDTPSATDVEKRLIMVQE